MALKYLGYAALLVTGLCLLFVAQDESDGTKISGAIIIFGMFLSFALAPIRAELAEIRAILTKIAEK